MRFLNRSAGRLSRHRRGPFAGLAVVLVALLLASGVFTVVNATVLNQAEAETSKSDEDLIKQGRELYLVGCSSCHGANAEGVSTARDGWVAGPSLVGAGSAAVDFQVGTGRMPMATQSAQAPRKKVVYTDAEIEALGKYIASLGPGPAVATQDQWDTSHMDDEEKAAAITRGGQIFLTNCTACHNFDGSGGAMPNGGYAPTLKGVEPQHIFGAMLTGPQAMDVFSNGNLSVDEKRDIVAYLGSLEEQTQYGGFALGNLGPVAEGLFAWVLGIGTLIGFSVWIAGSTTRSKKTKVEA